MRVRLLDMGEVSAVRSQSIYHAIATEMGPGEDPALVVVRSASAFVSIGASEASVSEVDLEFCRGHRIPVIRRHVAGEAEPLDDGHLLFQVLMPDPQAAELSLLTFGEACREALQTLGIEAVLTRGGDIEVKGRRISRVAVAEIGGATCLVGTIAFDFDPVIGARVLKHPEDATPSEAATALRESRTAVRLELDEPPELATVAEAVLGALESRFGFELMPSMPTPGEMEAIYEWDRRLPAEELLGAALEVEAPAGASTK